jgi:hypothetical protein
MTFTPPAGWAWRHLEAHIERSGQHCDGHHYQQSASHGQGGQQHVTTLMHAIKKNARDFEQSREFYEKFVDFIHD